MISGDIIIFTLVLVTTINFSRYVSSLRALLFLMREAHPLLYQQVDGGSFFTAHGNMVKQARLFHYLRHKEYSEHHDKDFVAKCHKVRDLFVVCCALLIATLVAAFAII